MKPLVSIIMGSASDLPVMESAARILNDLKIPFEMNALSAHRTPEEVAKFARGAAGQGIKVIIAGAGMAAHLPGVIASFTYLPVIGIPVNTSLEGLDSMLSIIQMPPGIPVAAVGINAAQNAGILAAQIIGTSDEKVMKEVIKYRESLKKKIVEANEELKKVKFNYKTN
jgi:5-(carboxyamino)imidazole ribonucleotide mutase